jgi:hypothetical protein
MSRLPGVLLPHKQMPSLRSKNVVQVTANPAKSETKSEKKGEKRFASLCHNLPFLSGLGRLRQDLVNLVPRLEGRRSIRLSYGRILGYSIHSTKVATPIRHLILPQSWSHLEQLQRAER